MNSRLSRRTFAALAAVSVAFAAAPGMALTDNEAQTLIERVVHDINKTINSGKPERAMFAEFERIFRSYADVRAVAFSVLGPTRRQASSAQLDAFADAFASYLARKYGQRFQEFVGGQIKVTGTRDTGKYAEVLTNVLLQGQQPFEVAFRVSDRSGSLLFFDIVIEGISLGKTERTEIQALLDRNRGNIDAMIEELKRLS